MSSHSAAPLFALLGNTEKRWLKMGWNLRDKNPVYFLAEMEMPRKDL